MKLLIALLFPLTAFANPSSQRELTGDHIRNNSAVLTVPTSTDTLVGRATADTLTNKSIAASGNTITGIANGNISTTAVIDFTKLATLTSGNILVGNVSNQAASVAASGDLTLASTGAFTLNTVAINKGGTNNASLATTAGGALYMDGTRAQNSGAGTATQVLYGGTTPTFKTPPVPTKQLFTTNGTVAGVWFNVTTGSVTYAIGDTYTDGTHTYTALSTAAGATDGWMSGTVAISGTTLTRSTGAGTASFSVNINGTLALYTPTVGTNLVKITAVGAGGSGGACGTTGVSQCSLGAGGGSGGASIKWLSNPSGNIYYGVGVGASAASAGANAGTRGGTSSVIAPSAPALVVGQGGYGGGTTAAAAAPIIASPSLSTALGYGGDINAGGSGGTVALCAGSASAVTGGYGGNAPFGGGGGTPSGFASFLPGSLGGGGAGCALTASTSATASGAGGTGYVLFEEFTQ